MKIKKKIGDAVYYEHYEQTFDDMLYSKSFEDLIAETMAADISKQTDDEIIRELYNTAGTITNKISSVNWEAVIADTIKQEPAPDFMELFEEYKKSPASDELD